MTKALILSLGSINADFQMRVDDEIGEIETQLAHDFVRLSGGKAANRAFLARKFGHPAQLWGRVGEDELSRQATGGLEELGVDLSGVTAAPGQPTAVSVIVVPPSGKKRIFLASNANACWDEAAAKALEAGLCGADPTSVLTVDFEGRQDIAMRALEAVARRGLRAVIDPSPGDTVGPDALALSAAVAPNAEEARALSGVEVTDTASAARAAGAILRRGASAVCLKLADGGALIAQADDFALVPPPGIDPVDTTGAGDAFTAALAIGLSEGRAFVDCACLGAAAAGVAVTRYGSQHEGLTPDNIEPLAARLRKAVRRLDPAQ